MPSLKELLEKPIPEIQSKFDASGLDPNKIATNEGDKSKTTLRIGNKQINFTPLINVVKSETSGINAEWFKNQPLIYGADILKLTTGKTQTVSEMLQSSNPQGGGLLGGITTAVSGFGSRLAGTLGFGEKVIPTRLVKRNPFEKALEDNISSIPEVVGKIAKGAEGGILGKLLKPALKGRPEDIGRNLIGTLQNAGQNAAKSLLFGNNTPGQNDAAAIQTLSLKPQDTTFGSKTPYTKIFDYNSKNENTLGLSNYLETYKPSETDNLYFTKKQIQNFPKFSVAVLGQGIPGKRDKTNTYLDKSNPSYNYSIEDVSGVSGKFRKNSDSINSSGFWSSADGNPGKLKDSTTLDDLDFIPLRFYSIARKTGTSFKATISGLTENFSPSWESNNFIGNPYSYYTYQSIGRDISFNFVIYSLNDSEHIKIWEKVDFLSSLVYPQNQTSDVYVTPPLLKMTLGNMYKNKLGFIESLSYTIEDNTPWEIGLTAETDGKTITKLSNTGDLKEYKLPTMINVSMTYKFVESSSEIAGNKLYGYGSDSANPNWQVVENTVPQVIIKAEPQTRGELESGF